MEIKLYENAIVSFVDILGFRDLIEHSTSREVKSKLDLLMKFAAPKVEDPSEYSFIAESISFSDCIVRVRRIEKEPNLTNPVGLAFYEILDLLHVQGELLNQGILIRGGVTFGGIYFQKNQIYGPALVKAYELEAKYAVYPRIVISPDLIKEVRTNKLLKSGSHTHSQDSNYIEQLTKQGDDGLWFIDYIRAMESELDDPAIYPDYLLKHKRIICDGAKEFQNINQTSSKYLWMAKYHNDFIGKIPNEWCEKFGTNRGIFEISSREMPLLHYL